MNKISELKKIKIEFSSNEYLYFYKIWTEDYDELCKIMYYDKQIYQKIMNINENNNWTYYTSPTNEYTSCASCDIAKFPIIGETLRTILYPKCTHSKITDLYFSNVYNFCELTDEIKELECEIGGPVGLRKMSNDELQKNKIPYKMFTNVIELLGVYSVIDDELKYKDYEFSFDGNDDNCDEYTVVKPEEIGILSCGEYGDVYLDIDKRNQYFLVRINNYYVR